MQTYLVAPSDKLFMVGFGELRVQRHHLQRKSKTRGCHCAGGFDSPCFRVAQSEKRLARGKLSE